MRNKLVKFHRKANYYKLRRTAVAVGFALLLTVSVAVPLTLLNVAAQESSSSETVSSQPGDILRPDILNDAV